MRKIKAIKIDDKEFTVKELTVQDVWNLKESGEGSTGSDIERLCALACPELNLDVAKTMAPSELKQIWEVFREVNADFLAAVAWFGVDQVLINTLKNEIAGKLASLTGPSASLSAPGTEQ